MGTRHFALVVLLFLLGLLIGAGGLVSPSRASQEIRPAAATTPTLALVAPPNPQRFSSMIDVQVTISGATNLTAFEFDLLYDHSLVRVTGVTLRNFLGTITGCNPNAARCAVALGPIDQTSATSLGAYSFGTGAGASGNGVLAVLHLQPTGAGGTTTLLMSNSLVTDAAANPLTPTTQGATLVFPSRIFLPITRK